MLTVLVTGGRGQLAQALAVAAQQYPVQLITLSREQCDLSQRSQIRQAIDAHQPDWIINAAAYVATDQAQKNRQSAFAINVNGVKNLAELCQQNQIKCLHYSTDYIFDGSKNSPYIETDIPEPLNIYGESKWHGEQWLTRTLDQHVILRTSWVFSEYAHNFAVKVLERAIADQAIRMVSDQIGTPTPALELAHASLAVIQAPHYGTYHLAGEPSASWFDLTQMLIDALHDYLPDLHCQLTPVTAAEFGALAKRPAYSSLCSQKFQQTFSFKPIDWRQSVDAIVHRFLLQRYPSLLQSDHQN